LRRVSAVERTDSSTLTVHSFQKGTNLKTQFLICLVALVGFLPSRTICVLSCPTGTRKKLVETYVMGSREGAQLTFDAAGRQLSATTFNKDRALLKN
jgi:hypothetical protein